MKLAEGLKQVFSLKYIFDLGAMQLDAADRWYMLVGFAMVLVGSGFKTVGLMADNPVAKNFWHRLASPFIVCGILEVIWYTARFENIRLFGSHMVAWLIAVVAVLWIISPVRYWFKHYKSDSEKWEKQQVKLKYLKRK